MSNPGTDTLKLIIPLKAPLLTPNGQRRAHWTQVAKAKAETELLVGAALHNAKVKKMEPPVSVRLIWFAPDARNRDADSLAVMVKAVLDALVKKGFIEDDNSRIVHEVLLGPIWIARDNPRFEVHIRRVEVGGRVQDR